MYEPASAFAAGLRFPRLVLLAAVLFGLDLIIPDAIPFIDEILLGLLALILASIKKRGRGGPVSLRAHRPFFSP